LRRWWNRRPCVKQVDEVLNEPRAHRTRRFGTPLALAALDAGALAPEASATDFQP